MTVDDTKTLLVKVYYNTNTGFDLLSSPLLLPSILVDYNTVI